MTSSLSIPFDYRRVSVWISELKGEDKLKWVLQEFMRKFKELDEELSNLIAAKKI